MSSRDEVYFANKEPKDKASVLLGRSNDWFQSLEANGYLDKLRTMWAAYHGAYYADSGNSHMITFGGEQGELTQIAINHLRNIAQHMLTMITSTRPTMQARSINTDYRSLVQTKLANGLLDYYMRDHRLETYLKTACEYAIVFGSGYVKMEWNATRGEVYDIDEESGLEIKEGDVEFSNLSPFDVMMDSNVEDRNHDWVLTRSFKNRFDLAAKYPEFRDGILSLPTKNELQVYSPTTSMYNETDLIPVYEFYHKRTEATPDGNYMLFVSDDIILLDSPMPYKSLPVYQIVPAFYLGTSYGYTPMFDILAPQDAINTLYSTVFTNQSTFGVQNLLVGRGSDINMSQLSSGLNVIEANLQAGGVTPLNLTNTPKEIFDFIQLLEKAIETVSSVNSVTRGNPDPNLRSANALALVQSMTLQFMSGLQQSYVSLIEDVGTGIVNILKDHAAVPRVATIVGKNNRSYLKEFTGKDLSDVSRVIVDIGNPLARTTAGRVEMAEQMLQMGVIKTPEQYFSVINTGQLDVMTEDTQSQLFLIKAENERLVNNEPVIAVWTDEHNLHIKEHASILADPELRFDAELVMRVTAHIQEHIELLKSTEPEKLQMIGQQPLSPPQAPPQPMQNVPDASMQGQLPSTIGGEPVATQLDQQGVAPDINVNMPQVDPALLANPQIQEQLGPQTLKKPQDGQ